jgi:hypothetical protein
LNCIADEMFGCTYLLPSTCCSAKLGANPARLVLLISITVDCVFAAIDVWIFCS